MTYNVFSGTLNPTQSVNQAAFAHLTAGQRTPPLKIAYSHWESGPHLICGSLVPPEPRPYRHVDQFSRFHEAHDCDGQTDRQTDRPRYSVCNNKPHVRSTATRPSNMDRGVTTFSKLGVQFPGLGYCTKQNADRIPIFMHCRLLCVV